MRSTLSSLPQAPPLATETQGRWVRALSFQRNAADFLHLQALSALVFSWFASNIYLRKVSQKTGLANGATLGNIKSTYGLERFSKTSIVGFFVVKIEADVVAAVLGAAHQLGGGRSPTQLLET